jgi:ferric-dicitrate binding protein FerR (iron transport regulator)
LAPALAQQRWQSTASPAVWRAERQEHELAWQRIKSLQAELSGDPGAGRGAQDTLNTSAAIA